MKKLVILIMILISTVSLNAQNHIHLKNGLEFNGKIITPITGDTLRVLFEDKIISIPLYNIESIDYDKSVLLSNPKIYTSSEEMMISRKLSNIGYTLYGSGVILMGAPYFLKDVNGKTVKELESNVLKRKNTNKFLVGGGCALFIIGTIFEISANDHMKKYINLQSGENGIGINIKLN